MDYLVETVNQLIQFLIDLKSKNKCCQTWGGDNERNWFQRTSKTINQKNNPVNDIFKK